MRQAAAVSIVSTPMPRVDQRPQQRRRREAQARAAAEDDELGLERGEAREVRRRRAPRSDGACQAHDVAAPRHDHALGVLDAVDDDAVGPVAGDRVLALDPVGAHLHAAIIREGSARRPLWSNIRCLVHSPRSPLVQALRQVEQARQRLLRHPRPGARQGAADGGRGPAHHQAEHRQHRRVRPRAARRDRAGHDPQPAERGRLHRLQGPVRAAQGDRPLHPAKARHGRDRRRRLPRQRRLRADHDEHERAAQRRRRGADPGARLPALDRRRSRSRAARRCTTCCDEASDWLPDLDDMAREDHAAHARASSSSTRTTRPARSIPTSVLQRDRRARARSTS